MQGHAEHRIQICFCCGKKGGDTVKESWLMVTKWEGPNIVDQKCWDKIRRIPAIGSKVAKTGYDYELELNGGIDYRATENKKIFGEVLRANKITFTVCAIPWSQAREYIDFMKWPCNKDFDA